MVTRPRISEGSAIAIIEKDCCQAEAQRRNLLNEGAKYNSYLLKVSSLEQLSERLEGEVK